MKTRIKKSQLVSSTESIKRTNPGAFHGIKSYVPAPRAKKAKASFESTEEKLHESMIGSNSELRKMKYRLYLTPDGYGMTPQQKLNNL